MVQHGQPRGRYCHNPIAIFWRNVFIAEQAGKMLFLCAHRDHECVGGLKKNDSHNYESGFRLTFTVIRLPKW